jgi:hypothetical protein
MNNMIFPETLLDQLMSASRIFLSVSPVIAFSDVLMEIEKRVATTSNPADVVPADKLQSFTKPVMNTTIISCGDMPLKELPSYLRGIIDKDGLLKIEENISASTWLALRVYVSNTNDHIFEFLSCSALELPKVSLIDSSWMKSNLLKNRFENSSSLFGNGEPASGVAREPSSTKAVSNDLEFLE